MTSKHVAAIGIAAVLACMAGVLVLLCGRNPTCAAPGTLPSVITLAGSIVGLATGIIGGVFGHAVAQSEVRRSSNNSDPSLPAVK